MPLPRTTGLATRALLLCVLVVPSCNGGHAAVAPPAFDAARAWHDLEAIVALGPRPAGSEALERTRQLLERELAAAGLAPVREAFRAPTPVGELDLVNVYADLPGVEGATDTVILAAHYDTKRLSVPFVGANDGGSAPAVLLELARVLASGPRRPVAYRFLFLDGEESQREEWADPDNRYGSRHHAAKLAAEGRARRVRALVLLDMVGDKDLCLWRESWSDRRLYEIVAGAARSLGFGKHVGCTSQPVEDDHQSFLAVGIPSIDLIDFEYGPRNGWWHTSEDTLDKCSAESLGIVGRIVLAALPGIESWTGR